MPARPPNSKGDRHRYIYSAFSKDPAVNERCLAKMEGVLARLRDLAPKKDDPNDRRPKAMPHVFLAGHLGCSPGTVKRWIQYHDGRRNEHEFSDRFCDVFELIVNELSQVVSGKTFAIACNVEHKDALRSQLWLLPRMDPYTYGSKGIEDTPAAQVADIPSEVFDAMSEAEREILRQLADQQDALALKTDQLIDEIAARVAAADPSDDQ
jgi:hypothetical protein